MISDNYFEIVSEDPMVVKGRIVMPYTYFVGRTATRFYAELRDHKKIWGISCERCQVTYMPPRNTCPRCFSRIEGWKEVGPEGVLETWTVTEYPLKVHPVKEPILYGIIRLDGADTGLVHRMGEVTPEGLKTGMRVTPVFREKREGNILDIQYFWPV